jgi:hypothetical protein
VNNTAPQTVTPPASGPADPSGAASAVLEFLIRGGGAVVVTAAAVLLAVVESFLVPIRLAQSYLPAAALLAVAGNVALPLAMLYLTRNRGLSLLPALAWFGVVLVASSATGEGDLIIPALWPGVAMLVAGAGTIAVMGYLTIVADLGHRLIGKD